MSIVSNKEFGAITILGTIDYKYPVKMTVVRTSKISIYEIMCQMVFSIIFRFVPSKTDKIFSGNLSIDILSKNLLLKIFDAVYSIRRINFNIQFQYGGAYRFTELNIT